MNTYAPFISLGKQYELSHLNAFYTRFIQPAQGEKTEKTYSCLVEFSHHCFTKSPNLHKGESLDDYPYELRYTTEKETRIFCFERYALSTQLPEIIRNMDKHKCFFTSANDKFLTIRVQTTQQQAVDYEIYFSLKKSTQCDIHLFINSAYLRSGYYPQAHPNIRRKPISLFVLLHNTLHNKKIKRPY